MASNTPKLRFKEFTDEWQEKKLGDIAELTSSKRVYLSDYVSSGIPFYRGKEISELKNNIIPSDILYISNRAYSEFKEKFGVPQKDDILITAVGTLGNLMRVKNNDPFYFKDGNLIWLRKVKENSEFLEITLENSKNKVLKSSIGSSQKALTIVGLNKLKFLFPRREEQEKISDFLTAVDEKINHLEEKKKGFEKYKKGVMQAIFNQKIRFKKLNGSNYPDWEEKQLGEIASLIKGQQINGSELDATGKYPMLNGGIVPSGYTHDWNVDTDTITVSEGGNSCGFVGYMTEQFWSGGHCYSIQKISSLINKIFLYQTLKFNQDIVKRLRVGSGLPNIQKSALNDYKISIPIYEEQEKIAEFLTVLDNKVDLINKELEQAKLFKKSLLQQMFV